MIYWIANLVLIGGISFLFFKKFKGDFSPLTYWAGLAIKLSAGLILGFIFLNNYSGGDSFLFFSKAKSLISQPFDEYLSNILTTSSYQITNKPRVLFFVKLLSPFAYLSGGSYWIASLYLSLISFMTSWWIVVRLVKIYPTHLHLIITCFLFIPTIVFWSSGILKDTITYSALMFLVGTAVGVHKKIKLSVPEFLLAALSIFILLKLKHYILITYLLFVGLLLFLDLIKFPRIRFKIMAVMFLFMAIMSTQFIHPYLNFRRLPLTIYENNRAIIERTESENQLNIKVEYPTWRSVAKELPGALKTGLYRPSIFDRTPKTGWLHKIENLLLTILSVISILIWIKEKPKIDMSLAIATSICILFLSVLLSLSTPNFGTLVRYKNVFMPFFFLLVSILPYQYLTSKRLE